MFRIGFMRQLVSLIIVLCLGVQLFAQADEQVNIVPNPGFEHYSAMPLGWFYTGLDFTRVMKYWDSPTAASPDVYGPRVYVPTEWQQQGFAQCVAPEGKSMIGITVYGCKGGKPHCREYVQAQLIEPLVVGQRYGVRLKYKHLPRSIRIANLGVCFVESLIRENIDTRLDEHPWVESDHVLSTDGAGWKILEGDFFAGKAADYIIIGNFRSDEETTTSRAEHEESLPFAYYYIDEVEVRKLPPILDVPPDPDDLANVELEKGKRFVLNNIYFDHDRADFLPRSYRELNTLLNIMRKNPNMRIEIHGHTDDVGTDDYNYQLSLSRAYAVVEFLTENEIAPERVVARGYGSDAPLDTNETADGRQKNRRVEFLVLSK